MFAFTAPIPLSFSARPRAAVTPLRSRPLACASQDPDLAPDAALAAGQDMRDQLRKLTEDRREQAERTQEALDEMSVQLSKMVATLRAEAGMPPVAEPPSTSSTDDLSSSSSSAVSPTASSPSPSVSSDESSSGDEPYMDPQNFGYESTAGWQVLAESATLPESEGRVEFRIQCDDDGCSIVEVKDADAPAGNAGVRSRFVQRGAGWRLGFDPDGTRSSCALVGSDAWLVSLSLDEIRHFKNLCAALLRKMDRIGNGEDDAPGKKAVVRRSGDGTYNMRVSKVGLDCSVELESKLLWVQGIGQPVRGQYCIRAIFFEQRQAEGFWAPDAVPGMLGALNKLGIE